MSPISRRRMLGSVAAAGVASAGVGLAYIGTRGTKTQPVARRVASETSISAENLKPGSAAWRIGADGTRAADDILGQIKGFASAAGVDLGDRLSFQVSAGAGEDYTVGIYRLGWYGGVGARHIFTTAPMHGHRQSPPDIDGLTGTVSCRWEPSWTLQVGADWMPGTYLAVLTTVSGWRNYVPFVVHDPARTRGICVVLPFATYQAYNQWPLDGYRGRSLYYGYSGTGIIGELLADGRPRGRNLFERRAYKVSFDRPIFRTGLPNRFDEDHYFIQWVEWAGYDVNYSTNIDLESGHLHPSDHAALVFSGHDEYWSATMRDAVAEGIRRGTSVAYLAANNIYWRVRMEAAADGRENRIMACYKTGLDADLFPTSATMRWREPRPGSDDAEQGLLGVQYNGIVKAPVPLVVRESRHWFWDGCGVREGDIIPKIIDGEADGLNPLYPSPEGVHQTLLSASPYLLKANSAPMTQNTSVYEADSGAMVFVAGTLNWTKGLAAPQLKDPRISRATSNLFDRMTGTS